MTLPFGFTVGHWTDPVALTGCTAIVCEGAATAGVHMGGGAPATIQTDIIGPGSATGILHAVLLTGGSAFGLAAYAGVMRFLEERGVGVAVRDWRVPHVAGAVIFDLMAGDGHVRPDANSGYAACAAATGEPTEGLVGAGTGGTVAKLKGGRVPGGLGVASARAGSATVTAVMVVNAVGDVWDGERNEWVARSQPGTTPPAAGANTTIGVVLTDAKLGREAVRRVAATAHDGLGRAIRPAHTDLDGDTIFALAYGEKDANPIEVQIAAADTVEKAIVRAVRSSGGTMRT
ncbi:MAG TPA: P1 family peptidase [Candidatus Limnocylindria bacterium]|nr:P1 family peptidase [Candidatus Limnocylindria bacterium]